jgi:hypothetical protein
MIYRLFGIGSPPAARPGPTGPTVPRGLAPSEAVGRLDSLAQGRETAGLTPSDTAKRIAVDAQSYQKKLAQPTWREAAARQAWKDACVVSGAMASSPLPALAMMLKEADSRAARSDRDTATVVRYQALHDFDLATRSMPSAATPRQAQAIESWREVFSKALCATSGSLNSRQSLLMGNAMRALHASVFGPLTVGGVRHPSAPPPSLAARPMLASLWDRYGGIQVPMPRSGGRVVGYEVGPALTALDRSGRLDDRLLEGLYKMADAPCDERLDRDKLVGETIVHLARPARTMAQGDHGTCTVQAITYALAKHRPHEYVRMARDIMAPEGRIRLGDGSSVSRVPDSVFADGGNRTDVERMLQAALMQAGRSDKKQQYVNALDVFMTRSNRLASAPSGLYPVQVALLATQVFKQGFKSWPMGEPGQGLIMIDRTLSEKKVPLLACVRWNSGSHCVSIERIEGDRVYYRNPQGSVRGRSLPVESGVRMDGEGFESLPAREFEQRLQSLVFPR